MMRVKIIKKGYGHSIDQVLTVSEFEGGHLMAFGFAVPYVENKVETRPQAPPEIRKIDITRIEPKEPEYLEVKEEKPKSIFRRGRPKK
jgi:hypothetical protein